MWTIVMAVVEAGRAVREGNGDRVGFNIALAKALED
jgi:hypothetical protein